MQVLDGQLVVSASDLNNFLACEHLTTLDLARARGEIEAPSDRGADAELVARKGDEHEARYLESLKAEGREVVEITLPVDGSRSALEAAAAQTEEALRAGPDVIYQATFFRPASGDAAAPGPPRALRGHADFLFRVDGSPSDLGSYSYEVADTKLARRAKPYFILQLCFYSELLAAAQGAEPERIHVILGTNEQHSFRLAEFSAYFRRVREGFLAELGDAGRDTYPEPVSHCSLCRWRTLCDERRVADDHLSLIAGITRRQRDLLRAAGFDTLAALSSAGQLSAPGIGADVLERLHEQASLQLGARQTGEHSYLLLAPQEARGFARLPRPSPGDVFFDMEGDPFFDGGGLEYLFGLVTAADGERPEFTAIWGRDRAEEKRALEEFIDLIVARRRRFPDLHIYHYASYEITALKRLAGAHGSREEELDQLLRDEVFVDLYKVVREAMRISQPSYSIKKVEAFYMDARETAVTDGGDSIVKFERWLEEGEGSILDEIAAYNEDDCLSTLRLRDWLLERCAEAEREFEGREEARWIEWFEPEPQERGEAQLEIREENEALYRALLEDGAGSDGRYPAARGILRRDPPRLRGREPGAPIDHDGMELEELKEIVAALDGSHLFIQGPPGSGKTYTGARLIVDLIGRGQRVGVTSSHKMIHPEARLTAGTAWHYCREEAEPLDYLFIDEADQVSLADALALSTAARNVVALGDPPVAAAGRRGRPPRGHLTFGSRAPAGGEADRRPRVRHLPRADLAPAPGRLRLRLGADVRRAPAIGPGPRPPAHRRRGRADRHRPALAAGRARGPLPVLRGGGRPHSQGDRAPAERSDLHRRRGQPAPPRAKRHPRSNPLQRPGQVPTGPPPTKHPNRHRRQVPRPRSPDRLLLNGHLQLRRDPPQRRVPIQPQPPKRGDLKGEVPGGPGGEPEAARHQGDVDRADAAGQRVV
ncbi:MAG TPA: TM0106 family RecB-like putative nuclease [Solirubrobacterales bacterium]|nr:TM0106 family RecB-like putative nuclease [Solirubrobacterales bacterium]